MNYWLIKSEPSVYSWDQLVKDKKVMKYFFIIVTMIRQL